MTCPLSSVPRTGTIGAAATDHMSGEITIGLTSGNAWSASREAAEASGAAGTSVSEKIVAIIRAILISFSEIFTSQISLGPLYF
jgi:hypothetical protein